jgi:hypothetical protein
MGEFIHGLSKPGRRHIPGVPDLKRVNVNHLDGHICRNEDASDVLVPVGPGSSFVRAPSFLLALLLLELAQRNAELGSFSAKISPIGLGRLSRSFGRFVFHHTLFYAALPLDFGADVQLMISWVSQPGAR